MTREITSEQYDLKPTGFTSGRRAQYIVSRKPTGFIFYRGPSMLDGAPIVAILTGLAKRSSNGKTGAMLQTWILRADMSPLEAVRLGHDTSICGDCRHRGAVVRHKGRRKNIGRSCYVRLDTAPHGVFKTFKRGRYLSLSPAEGRALIGARRVRAGSYGDPAAVPYHIWSALLSGGAPSTGYTHQWRAFPELAAFCMASVDTAVERAAAKLLGFRTFRVLTRLDALGAYEIPCPASEEAGHRTTCVDCVACGGHSAKARVDIGIIVHAGRDRQFAAALAA